MHVQQHLISKIIVYLDKIVCYTLDAVLHLLYSFSLHAMPFVVLSFLKFGPLPHTSWNIPTILANGTKYNWLYQNVTQQILNTEWLDL